MHDCCGNIRCANCRGAVKCTLWSCASSCTPSRKPCLRSCVNLRGCLDKNNTTVAQIKQGKQSTDDDCRKRPRLKRIGHDRKENHTGCSSSQMDRQDQAEQTLGSGNDLLQARKRESFWNRIIDNLDRCELTLSRMSRWIGRLFSR